jgi:hypothetical protein
MFSLYVVSPALSLSRVCNGGRKMKRDRLEIMPERSHIEHTGDGNHSESMPVRKTQRK